MIAQILTKVLRLINPFTCKAIVKKIILLMLLVHTFIFAATPEITFSEEEKIYLATNPTIRVCVNPTFAPFEFLTEKGAYEGIGAELLRSVAKKAGLRLEIVQTYLWKESLEKAKKNECDIINFLPQPLEFQKWLFTEPIFTDYNVIITRIDHPYIFDLKSLTDETIAIPEKNTLGEKLSYDFPNLTFFSVETAEDAIFLVLNHKIDMTIRPSTIAAYTLHKHGLPNLKISGILEDYKTTFRIAVAQHNPILRDILDKGIKNLSLEEKETIVYQYNPSAIKKRVEKKVWYGLGAILFITIGILLWNHLLRKEVKKATAINQINQKIMVQQAKQAELGQLIGNISHQWREPLSHLSSVNLMMIGFLEHKKRIDRKFLLQKFKDVENTLEFMSQTMQNFLEFYKPSTVQQHFNICEALEQMLSLVETSILSDKIVVDIQGDKEATLYGIKNEYMQVWLNLVNNAIRALHHSSVSPKIITITIDERVMKVCDNAKGRISHADFKKGVGLTMCSAILSRYHKKMTFENTSEGVCVTIEPHVNTYSLFHPNR